MSQGGDEASFDGQHVKEPVFGLDAWWIDSSERARAELAGFTVVDAPTVLATHLTELVRRNAADLLSRQSVQELVDMAKEKHATAVSELIPDRLSIGELQRVLQLLAAAAREGQRA
jgi:flagellar biosynthesis protein FlhA